MIQDYYAILEVASNASKKEIKLAYRKKIRLYHPDLNKSKEAEKIAKQINEAYNVLNDPIKKANYDMQYSFLSRISHNVPQPFTTQVYTNKTGTVNININQAAGRYRVENPDGSYFEVEVKYAQ